MISVISSRHRPTVAVINLGKIADNFRILKSTVARGAFVCPMVKANAYGHGDIVIAARLRSEGAENLGVGLIEEGLHLRENGDAGRVLHFGLFDTDGAEVMLEKDLTPVLSSRDNLESLVTAIERRRGAGRLHRPVDVHLKINTGMNRLGISLSSVSSMATRLAELAGKGFVQLKGVCTHFSNAEDFDAASGNSFEQLSRFRVAEKEIQAAGFTSFQSHIANSSATLAIARLKKADPTLENLGIRPGLSLYGVEPDTVHATSLGVRPALRFLSRITHIQEVRKGEGVSYGLRWRAERDSRIGVIPCGYADGYRRGLSSSPGTTFVIVRGQRVPVVGTVCMDYFMCDLTEVEAASIGDTVTLIGTVGGVSVTVNELATRIQSIPYEIFTGISERVPRLYVDDEASDRYS